MVVVVVINRTYSIPKVVLLNSFTKVNNAVHVSKLNIQINYSTPNLVTYGHRSGIISDINVAHNNPVIAS